MKFSESFVIGIVIEMLEKYRNNITLNNRVKEINVRER
mgnify:CR=1 FL=1